MNTNETITLVGKGLSQENARIFLHFHENARIFLHFNENACIFRKMRAEIAKTSFLI